MLIKKLKVLFVLKCYKKVKSLKDFSFCVIKLNTR